MFIRPKSTYVNYVTFREVMSRTRDVEGKLCKNLSAPGALEETALQAARLLKSRTPS